MADEGTTHTGDVDMKDREAPVTVVETAEPESAAADASAEAPKSDGAATGPADESPAAAVVADETAIENKDGSDAAQAADQGTETSAVAADKAYGASSKSKKDKRRSSGVPEHKTNKKLNRKKSMPALNLSAEPGSYWFVTMKGYPPWPAIVCDDDMLPAALLGKRPVSAKQPDGSYRADFADGGKNVKDRRYPVMFLGTNEFYWQPNTDMKPLDHDEIKKIVDADDRGKKPNNLWSAYQAAAEYHDLDYWKSMLQEHERNLQKLEEEMAAKEAEKAAKAAKKKAKEEKAVEDVEAATGDEEQPAKPKPASKKRKKDTAGLEGETPKPAKTPKLKVNGPKEGGDESAAKKKSSTKPKKSKRESSAATGQPSPPLVDDERREKMGKMVLHLRHKLQKGFLSRDQPPKEEEMVIMDDHFKSLEKLTDLEAAIIRETKINKVLKAILKLEHIPKEHVYSFKPRSAALLNAWAPVLGLESKTLVLPSTNGVKRVEKASSEKVSPEKKSEAPEVQQPAGDVAMADAGDAEEAAEA